MNKNDVIFEISPQIRKQCILNLLIFLYTVSYTVAEESLKILEWANNNLKYIKLSKTDITRGWKIAPG